MNFFFNFHTDQNVNDKGTLWGGGSLRGRNEWIGGNSKR